AIVAHLRTDERGVAVGRNDVAFDACLRACLVDHAARVTFVVEVVAPRHEIVILDGEAGGEERADIDARAGAEQDAVRVGDEDLAVGGDAAEDLREAAAYVPEQADAGAT